MWCIDIKIFINTTVITQQPWTSILVRTLLALTGSYSWVIWKLDMETPWSRIHKHRFKGIHLLKTFFKMSMVGLGWGRGRGGWSTHAQLFRPFYDYIAHDGWSAHLPMYLPTSGSSSGKFCRCRSAKIQAPNIPRPIHTKGRWYQLTLGKILKTLSRDAM